MVRFARRRSRAGMVLLLGLVICGLAAPLPAAAGQPLVSRLYLSIDNSCLYGNGAAPNTTLTLELRAPDGRLRSHFDYMTDGSGNWGYGCFWLDMRGGDRVVVDDGTNSRTLVIPRIDFKVNRVPDVVAGRSVPGADLEVSVNDCHTDVWSCDEAADAIVHVNAQGRFSVDFTGDANIKGQDYAEVLWQSSFNDEVTSYADAASFEVTVGDNFFDGDAPRRDVSMWIFDSNGNQRIRRNVTTDPWGEFEGVWRQDGNAVDVRTGDFVGSNIASDALMKIPNMNATFDPAADTASFHCFKNQAWSLEIEYADGNDWVSTRGTANNNGNFSVNTMTLDTYDLQSNDKVDIDCLNSAGDEVNAIFRVP